MDESKTHVPLPLLNRAIERGLGLSIEQFALTCMCCGNDFLEKSVLFYWVNERNILSAAAELAREPWNVERLVRRVYTNRLCPSVNAPRELNELHAIAARKEARLQIPTAQLLRDTVAAKLAFNRAYWLVDWKAQPQVLKPQEGEMKS